MDDKQYREVFNDDIVSSFALYVAGVSRASPEMQYVQSVS